jgi:hypothetical protein
MSLHQKLDTGEKLAAYSSSTMLGSGCRLWDKLWHTVEMKFTGQLEGSWLISWNGTCAIGESDLPRHVPCRY